jgi:VanZ family protein
MRPSYWVPAAGWMAFILWLSSADFAAAQTALRVPPLIQWVLPWLSVAEVEWLHGVVRKAAHVIVYAVLALLWYRAFARGKGWGSGPATGGALAIAVTWACVDELHQSTIASRTGSIADVVLDSTGAAMALGAVYTGRYSGRLSGRRAPRLVLTALLWTAAVGGVLVLALNWLAGVGSGWLWATTPTAWLAIWLRRRGPPSLRS